MSLEKVNNVDIILKIFREYYKGYIIYRLSMIIRS